jgi:hypothetical protein
MIKSPQLEDGQDTGRQLRLATALVAGAGALFIVFLGYRRDYAGHMLAGYGGTLALLLFLVVKERYLGWNAVALTAGAILIGVGTESTFFLIAIFDPVDFANQSLGACLACASVLGRQGSKPLALGLGVLSAATLAAGFVLAFS